MGDSSSSSTIIRRLRSLTVEGVVAVSALPGSGSAKGVVIVVSMGTASTLTGVTGSMELLLFVVFDTSTGSAGIGSGVGISIIGAGNAIVGVTTAGVGDVVNSASGGAAMFSSMISVGSGWTTGSLGNTVSMALAAARANLRFDTFSTFFLRETKNTNIISNEMPANEFVILDIPRDLLNATRRCAIFPRASSGSFDRCCRLSISVNRFS